MYILHMSPSKKKFILAPSLKKNFWVHPAWDENSVWWELSKVDWSVEMDKGEARKGIFLLLHFMF